MFWAIYHVLTLLGYWATIWTWKKWYFEYTVGGGSPPSDAQIRAKTKLSVFDDGQFSGHLLFKKKNFHFFWTIFFFEKNVFQKKIFWERKNFPKKMKLFFPKKTIWEAKNLFFKKFVFRKKKLSKKNEKNFFQKIINFPFRCRKKFLFSWKVSVR